MGDERQGEFVEPIAVVSKTPSATPSTNLSTQTVWTDVHRTPPIHSLQRDLINSVQTRCIVKGEAQKSPLFWRFSGGF